MKKNESSKLKVEALPDLAKACEDALTYINELLIDNEVDETAKGISDTLYNALKKAGRL